MQNWRLKSTYHDSNIVILVLNCADTEQPNSEHPSIKYKPHFILFGGNCGLVILEVGSRQVIDYMIWLTRVCWKYS